MESQLVIYKLKYAESSSSLMESDDTKSILKKKNEDLMEKIKYKDEIIKSLVNERDSIREAYFNCSVTNRNETLQNQQSSNFNINSNFMTYRNPSEGNFGNNNTTGTSRFSLNQLQNKDRQIRKITNSILENNNDKSILTKNNDNFNSKIIFDLNKSSIEENNKNNNVNDNQIYKDCNRIVGIGIGNDNLNIHKSNSKKSLGIVGSLKNLFSDKSKKNFQN